MTRRSQPLLLLTLGIAFSALVVSGCSKKKKYDINIQSNISAGDGLDLKAVGELVKTVKTAKELEAEIEAERSCRAVR